jgi:hypothetical protein
VSLNYFYGDVKDADTVVFDENDNMRPEVQSVIFLTMTLGMPKVTEENASEFYRRYLMVEPVFGWKDTGVDLALLRSLAGLSTNASSKTMAAFKKDVMRELEERAERKVMSAVLKLKEEAAASKGLSSRTG